LEESLVGRFRGAGRVERGALMRSLVIVDWGIIRAGLDVDVAVVFRGATVVVEAWRRRGDVYEFEESRWLASIRRGEEAQWRCFNW
jgi:hypothetical protein